MMRTILITIIALFVACASLEAQTKPSSEAPAQKAARTVADLGNRLSLNQDQQQVVLCAFQDFYEERDRMFAQHALTGGGSDGFRLQLFHKRESCQQKVFATLSAEQAKRYQEYLDGLQPR